MDKNTYEKTSQFGYELIRDHVIPSILGKHEGDILYWAGKELARKFPVFDTEEIPAFFHEAGWGELTAEKTSKKEAFYKLHSPSEPFKVSERNFQLEAGFIAEQFQKLNGFLTECYAKPNSKDHSVTLHIAWDKKEAI